MDYWIVASLIFSLIMLNDAMMSNLYSRNIRPADESSNNKKKFEDKWVQQDLDHFDFTNSNKWKQRYHVVDEYYKQGGPAILIIEGEWEANAETLSSNAAYDYAKKLNGILFQLEHRFYGQSRPTSDLSVPNLRFLSADQALVDTAYFIVGMNSEYKLPKDIKWITFGCSYSAALAVWMREKFPHLVFASVAYSAPVLAKLNFYEYKNVIRDTYKSVSEECMNAVKEGHIQLRNRLKEKKDLSDLKPKFKLCDPIDGSDEKEVQSLLERIADNIGGVAQNMDELSLTVQGACTIMLNASLGDYIDRYAELSNHIQKDIEGKDCVDYKYSKTVEQMRQISWDSGKSKRQWNYQTCTELGYFQTSYKPDQLFSTDIPLSFYVQQCIDYFGEIFNEKLIQHGVDRTNIVFGGKKVLATRVAYVSGMRDPWLPLSITETDVPGSSTIVIDGQSHCVCVYTPSDSDSKVLKDGCNRVEQLVIQWSKE